MQTASFLAGKTAASIGTERYARSIAALSVMTLRSWAASLLLSGEPFLSDPGIPPRAELRPLRCCLPNGAVSLRFLLFDHDLKLIREWCITGKSLNVLLINSYTEINSGFCVWLVCFLKEEIAKKSQSITLQEIKLKRLSIITCALYGFPRPCRFIQRTTARPSPQTFHPFLCHRRH